MLFEFGLWGWRGRHGVWIFTALLFKLWGGWSSKTRLVFLLCFFAFVDKKVAVVNSMSMSERYVRPDRFLSLLFPKSSSPFHVDCTLPSSSSHSLYPKHYHYVPINFSRCDSLLIFKATPWTGSFSWTWDLGTFETWNCSLRLLFLSQKRLWQARYPPTPYHCRSIRSLLKS